MEWSENAVVATTAPHLAYLRTGHKAVLPPFDPNPASAGRMLDQVPVSYLVVDNLEIPGICERYVAPVLAYRPENWRLCFTAPNGATRVYERVR